MKHYAPTLLTEHTPPTPFAKLSSRLKELSTMLTYARPDDSDTEDDFIVKYIDTLPCVSRDAYGNRFVQIGKSAPNICWTSHTDTVHRSEGKQAITINNDGHIALASTSQASCLGADCTAGVWLMRRMILAGKAGLYIFHRGEEDGGLGASYILKHSPERFKYIDAVISLDRRGYDSVVTTQCIGTTASTAFAKSLAAMLPEGFKPDNTGTFTDSAIYAGIVAECSNVSVGYHNCHGTEETLDYKFTDTLLNSLLKVDYNKLVIARDETVIDAFDDWCGGRNENKYPCSVADNDNLASLVGRYPETAAQLLEAFGLNEDDFLAELDSQQWNR